MNKYFDSYLNSYRGLSQPAWMLAIVMLINRTGAMVLPFLGIYMTENLGFTLKESGYVLSCYGLGSLAGSLIGGWLTDRFGHFRVQTGSLFLAVPAFVALSFLDTLPGLAMGVFTLSCITDIFRPANSVSISHYTTPENITRAFSLNRMALNLGFSIGPALGGLLAAISYHLLFYGNGFTSALAGIVLYFYFNKREKARRLSRESEPTKRQSGVSPWRDFPFLIFSFLCCLFSLCFFQLMNTIPIYYKEQFALDNKHIGLLMGFNGLVVFALEMLLVSFAERKFSVRRIIVSGVAICGFSFIILAYAQNLSMLYLAMFVFSISEILVMPFLATVAIQRAGQGRRGAYMGLNSLTFSIAFIVSPLLGTFAAQQLGFKNLWLITFALAILTSIALYQNLSSMKLSDPEQ